MKKSLSIYLAKSDFPGKPSLYKTTSKFLETFGFENLKNLPSQEEIEELLPYTKEENKKNLGSVSKEFNQTDIKVPYEKDEQENKKIKNTLKNLPSTVEFLKSEKAINQKANQAYKTENKTNRSKEDSKKAGESNPPAQ